MEEDADAEMEVDFRHDKNMMNPQIVNEDKSKQNNKRKRRGKDKAQEEAEETGVKTKGGQMRVTQVEATHGMKYL